MTLGALNAADAATFVATLSGIFEDSPWVAARVWPQRPFADVTALHAAMCIAVGRSTPAERLALVRAHPDLVGRAALAGTLSAASAHEQAAAGLDHLDLEERAMFARLNTAYRERFSFPFVICVRENKKAAILAGLVRRTQHDAVTEMRTALNEIAHIAWLRLCDVVTA